MGGGGGGDKERIHWNEWLTFQKRYVSYVCITFKDATTFLKNRVFSLFLHIFLKQCPKFPQKTNADFLRKNRHKHEQRTKKGFSIGFNQWMRSIWPKNVKSIFQRQNSGETRRTWRRIIFLYIKNPITFIANLIRSQLIRGVLHFILPRSIK